MEKMREFFKGKTVFITGHTGFKGSWMCEMLLHMGAEVYGYALEPPTNPALFSILGLADRMHSEIGDVKDFRHLQAFMSKASPQIVIHMAAQPIVRLSYEMPVETYGTNVMGTVNVLECVRRVGSVRSVVNVTTDKVYRNDGRREGYPEDAVLDGFDPYSNSKSCSELVTGCYKRSFLDGIGIAASTVRAGNVIGGGDFAKDRLIPDCVRAAETKRELRLRNPSHIRPFWHVLDACHAYLLTAWKQYEEKGFAGSYNIGPAKGEEWRAGDMAELFVKELEKITGQSVPLMMQNDGGPHEDTTLLLDSRLFEEKFAWKPKWATKTAVEKTAAVYGDYLKKEDIRKQIDVQVEEFVL